MIKNINVVFGKPMKGINRKKSVKPPKDSPFKKQSIFFRYWPYWKDFEIGHAIDTMHIENGVFEMCFPPSFFDMMEHYMIHFVDQIFVLGPSYMHYMYTYERYMVVMKGYVRNRAHLESSMIEGHTTEEVIECYAYYIKDGKPIGVSVSRHHDRLSGKGTKGVKSIIDFTYGRVCETFWHHASVSGYETIRREAFARASWEKPRWRFNCETT
jgi:hypothetical protein